MSTTLPTAALAGPELDVRLLVDHRERLVRQRVGLNNTLQWNLHDLWPELVLPGGALFSRKWSGRIGRRLARAEQTMRVRIARDELRRLRELTQAIKALEAEIADLVAKVAPQLLTEPGFGPLTAAKLVGEIAGADRFATDAKLARAAGLAPIPVSSGKTDRHRLDRGGNRQSTPPSTASRSPAPAATPRPTTTSPARRAEGKTTREAIRCLKRHLARRIWHLLQPPHPDKEHRHHHQFLDIGAADAIVSKRSPASVAFASTEQCRDPTARLSRRLCLGWIFLVVPGVSGASLLHEPDAEFARQLDQDLDAGQHVEDGEEQSQTERRRNRTFQPPGYDGLPVLKAPARRSD